MMEGGVGRKESNGKERGGGGGGERGMRERSGWQNLVYNGGERARENRILRVRGRKREATYYETLCNFLFRFRLHE